MRIGKLRHKIELQSYTTTDDDFGQPIKTWSTYATIWAWVRPMSGRELMNAQQPVGEITHKVTIRHNADVTPAHRIKFGSRYFDINFVGDYDERNEYIEMMCKEKV